MPGFTPDPVAVLPCLCMAACYLGCSIDQQVFVNSGLIPGHYSIDGCVLQVCYRIAHRPCKPKFCELIVHGFHDVLCFGLLVANGVGVDVHGVHQGDGVLDVGGSHALDDCIVFLDDGHRRKLCWYIDIFAGYKHIVLFSQCCRHS